MRELVLSVWAAGDLPDDGAPIRLQEVGSPDPIATHSSGFDSGRFLLDGQAVLPESIFTETGLLDGKLMKLIGSELWRRLTPGNIGLRLAGLLKDSRIYLDLRSEALNVYPWEVMTCEEVCLFAHNRCNWSIGRPTQPAGALAGDPPDLDHPLRVLVVIGNKVKDGKIRADQELEEIERQAHLRNADVLLKVLYRPPANAIDAALGEFKPHLFHFIGHGAGSNDQPEIHVWADEINVNETWDADKIRSVFSKSPPRLVVLNACHTAGGAVVHSQSLAAAFSQAGCLSVIAIMGAIRGDASVEFSREFYKSLFSGNAVDVAAAQARYQLKHFASPSDPAEAGTTNFLRSNWPLSRMVVRSDAGKVLSVGNTGQDKRHWLIDDFVDRWDHRWKVWSTVFEQSSLAVLTGREDAGKTELLKALAEVWKRSGRPVINVDVSKGETGDWRVLLARITKQAEEAKVVAVGTLPSVADRSRLPDQIIPEYLRALEACADALILIVLDGLSEWDKSLIEGTVLPEICAPFVHRDKNSRIRMMIALRESPNSSVWGAVPEGWAPIKVGDFSEHEWKRALAQFALHWRPKVTDAKRQNFDDIIKSILSSPAPTTLQGLRSLAIGMQQ